MDRCLPLQDWRICDPLLTVVAREGRLLGGAVAIALTLLVCCSVVMFYVEALCRETCIPYEQYI